MDTEKQSFILPKGALDVSDGTGHRSMCKEEACPPPTDL